MKVSLCVLCLSSLVSLACLLTPGQNTSRCRRGGADSKQLMHRQRQKYFLLYNDVKKIDSKQLMLK